jgi:hypothetical protein
MYSFFIYVPRPYSSDLNFCVCPCSTSFTNRVVQACLYSLGSIARSQDFLLVQLHVLYHAHSPASAMDAPGK